MVKSMLVPAQRSTRRSTYGEKVGRFQGSATDQPAVYIRLSEQLGRVVRLDAASVKDAGRTSDFSIRAGQLATQQRVHLLRLGRTRGTAGADRPNRLVGQDHAFERNDAAMLDYSGQL